MSDAPRLFWSRLRSAGPSRVARAAIMALRHRKALLPLRRARPDSALGRLIAARPEVWGMVVTPYLSARWSPPQRLARIVDHCETIERLGFPLDTPLDSFVNLLVLDEIDPVFRIVLDQPSWLLRDGQATFSLWEGADRLVSLSYCLSSDGGILTAHIGGCQGRGEAGVLDRYRRFTKRAEGIRPIDFTIELFRLFCRSLGVTHIRAVSGANHHQQSAYSVQVCGGVAVHLSYDALWASRDGHPLPDGDYALALDPPRRAPEEIPANKRAMYRRRYALVDALASRLEQVVRDGERPGMLGRYPRPTGSPRSVPTPARSPAALIDFGHTPAPSQ
ncbi:DUF535 family protein [Methylorubrum salsuginis]